MSYAVNRKLFLSEKFCTSTQPGSRIAETDVDRVLLFLLSKSLKDLIHLLVTLKGGNEVAFLII
jgi:hypothetical protein